MSNPIVDANIVGTWPLDDQNRYNKLPYYFEKAAGSYRKRKAAFQRLITRTIPWKPNQGAVQRRVAVHGSPILRQEVNPNRINTDPKTDMPDTGESFHDLVLYWQDFATKPFGFLPAFQDMMGSHIQPQTEILTRDMQLFEELFYRTHVYHYSPYVYICGIGLVKAPVPSSYNAVTSGKSLEWLKDQVIAMLAKPENGYLNLQNVYDLVNCVPDELGVEPYAGQAAENGDKLPLNEQYAILTSPRVWRGFLDDPWLKENRPLNMNIVTEGFRGDLFGLAKVLFTGLPQRYLRTQVGSTSDFTLSMPAPEEREQNPDHPDYMRPKPATDFALNADIEVSYLFGGGSHYARVATAPPPSIWSAAKDGRPMNWNGKVSMSKDFLIPALDAGGNTVWQTNSKGRYVRAEGTKTMGIARDNPHQVIPIIHFVRKPRLTTLAPA